MKRFLPVFICVGIMLLLLPFSYESSTSKANTYPNLPAPIAKEKVLVTSSGQAVEGAIVNSIAENLNLEVDYRPRALASDLYEYNSVIVVVGYSKTGLSHTLRNFKEEMNRSKQLVKEAESGSLPVILVDLSGVLRDDARTFHLIKGILPYTTYYIGVTPTKQIKVIKQVAKENNIYITLVDRMSEIEIPLNSAFR